MTRSYSRPSWLPTLVERGLHGAGVLGGFEVVKCFVDERSLRGAGLNARGEGDGSHNKSSLALRAAKQMPARSKINGSGGQSAPRGAVAQALDQDTSRKQTQLKRGRLRFRERWFCAT